ncbi:pirin family protein [Ferviditalea candida]|uniref:Pirin family protein n=1 Tax=Ferviditalea candida TaxID=3108399 RepID=A0ABU5ZIG2_9BACL|nr:pirin family protein [Paenibacillaceae bacterium T2]
MIRIFPDKSRFNADHGWLNSRFSFSFAEYYDPHNLRFGPLRVLNDDIVQPGTGFGTHPHREMEIVTVVLDGELQHEDSTGNKEIIRYGEIQRMTAGTGILHSEVNPSSDTPVNFLQLWIEPAERGLTPSYEQIRYTPDEMLNSLLPVVSQSLHEKNRVAYIHQNATLYLSKLEAGRQIDFQQQHGRKNFLFVIEGDLKLNGEHSLQRRDSARIEDVADLQIHSGSGAFFMLIDLP